MLETRGEHTQNQPSHELDLEVPRQQWTNFINNLSSLLEGDRANSVSRGMLPERNEYDYGEAGGGHEDNLDVLIQQYGLFGLLGRIIQWAPKERKIGLLRRRYRRRARKKEGAEFSFVEGQQQDYPVTDVLPEAIDRALHIIGEIKRELEVMESFLVGVVARTEKLITVQRESSGWNFQRSKQELQVVSFLSFLHMLIVGNRLRGVNSEQAFNELKAFLEKHGNNIPFLYEFKSLLIQLEERLKELRVGSDNISGVVGSVKRLDNKLSTLWYKNIKYNI